MKYKILLPVLAVAALTMGKAKAADDITSPLYLPSELEALSDTSVAYKRTSFKKVGAKEDFILRETALFGFGREGAILASIGNRFNTAYLTNQDYNNDINLDYELGVRKNFRSVDGLIVQVGASYYTFNPRSWYGRSGAAKDRIRAEYGNTRWQKEIRGEIKAGYELETGLMPYASLDVDSNIDTADRDLYYNVLVGVHKLEYNCSFDAGLRYEFDFGSDKEEAWYMQAAADYFLTDNMTLGGYVDYQFAGSSDPKVDYAYTLEARLKILF